MGGACMYQLGDVFRSVFQQCELYLVTKELYLER